MTTIFPSINATLRVVCRFAVTEIGLDYYRHCQVMVEEAEAAEGAIQSAKWEPQGIIKVTCPPGVGALGANAMIADFIALYPKVLVHLESTNREVDPLSDGVDIALRVRFPPAKGRRSRRQTAGKQRSTTGCAPKLGAGL
ncbi:LysR substrate-binding domain-containing protein [Pseudomonas xanthosomatis]|uniref:LysR substrate-binding domain-containing protein n=1 Tax=Pseudomonas xanthosomatis TaxID=2842356 RepID=UPI00351137DB